MTKAEQAVAYHKAGYNCAQSVISVFAEDFNLDQKLLSRIATGFGGGIGEGGEGFP